MNATNIRADRIENSPNCDICMRMDPKDVLLSIAKECPYDSRLKSCPIKEVEEWRSMDVLNVLCRIQSLPSNVQKELAEKHLKCSCTLSFEDHKHKKKQ